MKNLIIAHAPNMKFERVYADLIQPGTIMGCQHAGPSNKTFWSICYYSQATMLVTVLSVSEAHFGNHNDDSYAPYFACDVNTVELGLIEVIEEEAHNGSSVLYTLKI